MKKLAMWSSLVGVVAVSLTSMLFVTGCDNGGDSGGGNSVVGTWAGDGDGRTAFKSDGTWGEYTDATLSSQHLGGTYSQSGNHVTGTGNNPGVGDLEIDGTVSDDGKTLQLDFIEHWHDPYKHNPATLTRQ